MTTKTFEGPDLDTTLASARSAVGSTAKIIRAEKVRSSGLGGFFAKEWVEVEVEVEGVDEEATQEQATFPTVREFFGRARKSARADEAPAPQSLLELADIVSDVEGSVASISTEGTAFAQVLDRIRTEADEPARPAVVVDDWIDTPRPVIDAVMPSSPVPAIAEGGSPMVEAMVEGHAMLEAQTMVEPAPIVHAPLTPVRVAAPASAPPILGALSQLGIPVSMLSVEVYDDRALTEDIRSIIIGSLAALPMAPPLPSSRGSVMAIIGPRADAADIAASIGIHAAEIVTVTQRRTRGADPTSEITRIEEVTDHRRSWRRRPRPTIVVVDTPLTPYPDWALDVLDNLEPSLCLGIAEATRKADDVAAWCAGLGGVDALALKDLDHTVSPAAMLDLGIPIALIDGEPATPEAWADLLIRRIAA